MGPLVQALTSTQGPLLSSPHRRPGLAPASGPAACAAASSWGCRARPSSEAASMTEWLPCLDRGRDGVSVPSRLPVCLEGMTRPCPMGSAPPPGIGAGVLSSRRTWAPSQTPVPAPTFWGRGLLEQLRKKGQSLAGWGHSPGQEPHVDLLAGPPLCCPEIPDGWGGAGAPWPPGSGPKACFPLSPFPALRTQSFPFPRPHFFRGHS